MVIFENENLWVLTMRVSTAKGRAKKRLTYTRRFVNVTLTGGKRKVRMGQRKQATEL